MTRWLFYFSILAFYIYENLPKRHTNFVKVGSKICQILNKRSKNCRKLLRFWQSGEISPNLVTLLRYQGPRHILVEKLYLLEESSIFTLSASAMGTKHILGY